MNENEEILQDEINMAIIAGLKDAMVHLRLQNGKSLTAQKKREMRNALIGQLLNDFKQLFIEVKVSREQATAFITYAVDKELESA